MSRINIKTDYSKPGVKGRAVVVLVGVGWVVVVIVVGRGVIFDGRGREMLMN